jgi:hypothetical protein
MPSRKPRWSIRALQQQHWTWRWREHLGYRTWDDVGHINNSRRPAAADEHGQRFFANPTKKKTNDEAEASLPDEGHDVCLLGSCPFAPAARMARRQRRHMNCWSWTVTKWTAPGALIVDRRVDGTESKVGILAIRRGRIVQYRHFAKHAERKLARRQTKM